MIAILLLIGCATEPTPALSIESISCPPGDRVEQTYGRAVYAARGLLEEDPESWSPLAWVQEGDMLTYTCPAAGLIEVVAY